MRNYNSDKEVKGLFDLYDELLKTYDVKGNMLEVGVLHGGALRFFQDTGRFTQIVGADINPPPPMGEGITLHKVDQGSPEQLEELTKIYEPFNLIIDDGSHQLEHVVNTFNTLWNHTKGIYIIEDWDVAYHWSRFDDWMVFITRLLKYKRELGAQEVRVCFDEHPDRYHGYIMLRRG